MPAPSRACFHRGRVSALARGAVALGAMKEGAPRCLPIGILSGPDLKRGLLDRLNIEDHAAYEIAEPWRGDQHLPIAPAGFLCLHDPDRREAFVASSIALVGRKNPFTRREHSGNGGDQQRLVH